ncbi:MAG TPA: adenosylcobinamide-phosphate synthase CbiB [Acidimicrobiales bacterium]|nr:adenosylcobinamide-phosphate synthase CbiB [Acidimicrobiales bacterium]
MVKRRRPLSPAGRWGSTAAGLALAQVLPEPPDRYHPVAWFGRAMSGAEARRYRDDRRAGIEHVVLGAGVAAVAGMVLRRAAGPAVAGVAATALTVGARMLTTEALTIEAQLAGGDLDAARSALPALVGRDPSDLGEEDIARAVVESVAENTVDAVVAPVVWAAVGGGPGALVYRAVNTMDSMVGHHGERYERFGWAAARLDDIVNWVPARLTAAIVAAVRPARAGEVWRAVRDDAPAHPSPNAGVVEAAFAAALGVRLGGTNRYGQRVERRATLGRGRPVAPGDIGAAVRLSRQVNAVLIAALVAAAAVPAATRLLRGR